MKKTTGILVGSLVAAFMLVSSQANAQQVYSMFGRLVSNRGEFIKIPVIGEAVGNCNNFKRAHTRKVKPGKITGSPFPVGDVTAPGMLLKSGVVIPKKTAAPFGCVDGAGMITATAKGKGARFTLPKPAGSTTQMGIPGAFFNKPLPNHTVAVYIPNEEKFPQLATSFRIDAPQPKIPTVVQTWTDQGLPFQFDDRAMGFFRTPAVKPGNLAPHRVFLKQAWQGGPAKSFPAQTGRAGANFTWCFRPGTHFKGAMTAITNPNGGRCDYLSQGTGANGRMFLKYRGGPNRFGGTMSYVISTGPGKSNLALAPNPNMGTNLILLRLGGMGQQPTGRGYADRLTDAVKTGPIWQKYKTASIPNPDLGGVKQKLITSVMSRVCIPVCGMSTQTALTNSNIGFPFTTGTILARATGTTPGLMEPATTTVTAMGSDRTVPDLKGPGNGRIITLVAGQLARTTEGSNTPGLLFMPEPSDSFQLLAGSLALAAIGLARVRRRH